MYRVQGADQKEYGPIPAEKVREWITQGRLNRQSLVSAEATPGWKPLSEFPEFATDVGGLAAPVTPIAATPAPFPTSSSLPVGSPPSGPPGAITSPRQNVLAIVTLVLGILSVPSLCCCYGIPFNVAGVVCGFIALSQLRARPHEAGRGLAITGLALAAASLLLGVVLLIVGAVFSTPEIFKNLRP